jgi:hypothetical protein
VSLRRGEQKQSALLAKLLYITAIKTVYSPESRNRIISFYKEVSDLQKYVLNCASLLSDFDV